MEALKILSEEHKNILKVITSLLKECDSLQSTNKINKAFFKKTIDFIREYADKFHHTKEEDILFVELCKDEVKMHCNPTQQMLYEHDLGRAFVKKLEEGIEENNKDKIIENSRGYAHLLQEHISKEDTVLYPMADEALSQETENKMLTEFEKIAKENASTEKKYIDFVKNLK